MKEDAKMLFSQALRKIRLRRKISQETLADMIGMHRNSVAMLERGERNPSLATIQKLAEVLKVKPSKFFERF